MSSDEAPSKPPASQRSWRDRFLDPVSRQGALFYSITGGLIVWLLVDVIPHIRVAISWHP
ncbi:hypothetical protein [Lentzea aerocolonigenes]|uniref:hypothetical protein n=1 Tax=Lentzea aerocolonigenes TaxID=68170 RepID=UPI000B25B569|nr:hypothetical protein [Lentzea aerocolonigenes]MCP2245711.1 hypothetical protein [Lentzea aerocolonigenes]